MAEDSTAGKTLHLRVSIGDVTVEVDGPIDDAETWFEGLKEDFLNDVDPEVVAAAAQQSPDDVASNGGTATPPSAGNPSTTKTKSLPEYYKMAENPTKRDAALIVGWYLEYHDGKSDFTRPEVEEKAKDAKIKLGANVSRDLSAQVGDGRLQKVDERDGSDAYSLTITGEEYVKDDILNI